MTQLPLLSYGKAFLQEAVVTSRNHWVMSVGDMEEKLSNFLQIFEHSGTFKVEAGEEGNQFTKAFKVPLKQNRTVSLKVGNRLRSSFEASSTSMESLAMVLMSSLEKSTSDKA